MKRLMIVALLLSLSLLLAACPQAGESASTGGVVQGASQSNTLTVVQVDDAVLDAAASYWADAPKLAVPMVAAKEGNPDGPTVTLQAAHDDTYLTMRAEWSVRPRA